MALFTRTKKEEFVPITQEELDQVTGEMMQQRLQFETGPENVAWKNLDDIFTQLREYFMRYRALLEDYSGIQVAQNEASDAEAKRMQPEKVRIATELDNAKKAAKGKLSFIAAAIQNIEKKFKHKKVGAKARELLEIIFLKMGPEVGLDQQKIKQSLPKRGWFS